MIKDHVGDRFVACNLDVTLGCIALFVS